MLMTRVLFFIIVVLCFFKNDQSIKWQDNYKLSWSDFKGVPNKNSDAAAVTSSGITFGYRLSKVNDNVESINVELSAHFYPEKSWVKPNDADNHILGHEQLHFDITELHARKLRRAILEIALSNSIHEELDAIHLKMITDLNMLQNLYDNETDFSRNHESQVEWQNYIKRELETLKAYK